MDELIRNNHIHRTRMRHVILLCVLYSVALLMMGYLLFVYNTSTRIENFSQNPFLSKKCDEEHSCADNSTCCSTIGGWECCPIEDAVCCEDGVYCCPSGFECGAKECIQGGMRLRFALKKPAYRTLREVEKVVCSDGSTCPNGNTCCLYPTGGWGCCPIPGATCCNDGLHCCPSGHVCDSAGKKCYGLETKESISWYTKFPSTPLNVTANQGISDEKTSSKRMTAVGREIVIGVTPAEFLRHTFIHRPSKSSVRRVERVYCSAREYCSDGNTCCLTSHGWSCCPLPDATCCIDGRHCCPHGNTCDLTSSRCYGVDSKEGTPWVTKTATKSDKQTTSNGNDNEESEEEDILIMEAVRDFLHPKRPFYSEPNDAENGLCPDHASVCPAGNTCCSLSTGGYGCCPMQDAVCCSDGRYCCPSGYVCGEGACNPMYGRKGFLKLFKKFPATPIMKYDEENSF